MKKLFFFIVIFSLFIGCNVRQKRLVHYLSTGIENIEIFPASKEDSLKINAINIANDVSLEKCKKLPNTSCIDHGEIWFLDATFPKGISNFRSVLFEKFKLPKNAKEGESRVRVTIGNHNNLEKTEILKYSDKNTKKAIEEAFRSNELNTWRSARIYGIPVKEQFEISIFIEKK